MASLAVETLRPCRPWHLRRSPSYALILLLPFPLPSSFPSCSSFFSSSFLSFPSPPRSQRKPIHVDDDDGDDDDDEDDDDDDVADDDGDDDDDDAEFDERHPSLKIGVTCARWLICTKR